MTIEERQIQGRLHGRVLRMAAEVHAAEIELVAARAHGDSEDDRLAQKKVGLFRGLVEGYTRLLGDDGG